MVLPVVLLCLIFILALINGMGQSFGIIPSLGMTEITFKYYKEIFGRSDFISSLGLSLYTSLVSSVIAVMLGVLISAVLSYTGIVKNKSFEIFKVPVIVPHTVVALLVINIFSQSGILSRIAYNLGFIENMEAFIPMVFDKNGIGIILAYIWKEIPFILLVVIPIMSNIDSSLGEAAINLGATKLKAFMKITLPLSMSSIVNSFVLIFAFSFGAFEIPYLLGVTSPKALPVLAYLEYTQSDLANRPYAMAINGIMIIITVILALLYYKTLNKSIKKLGR